MVTHVFAENIIHPPAFSSEAYSQAERGFIDFFASCLAASNDPAVPKILSLVEENSFPAVPLIGLKRRLSPAQAALFNGFIGHVLDFDDVHEDVRGHPSTVIIPALLSAADSGKTTGRRLLEAYIIGVETMAVLGKAIGKAHYERGFHNTATLGGIAAAAACSYLLGFSEKQAAAALGLAATQASGLRVQFGTETKPLHAGFAAQSAYQAVELAQAGFSGSETALDGASGFFAVYGDGPDAALAEVEQFGKPWKIVSPGLWFKQYAFCSAAHQGADAIGLLLAENPFSLADVEHITVTYPPRGDAALVYKRPETGEQGRFSIEYVLALAIDEQKLSSENFTARPVDPAYRRFFEKIERRYSTDIQASQDAVPKGRFTRIDCRLKTGSRSIQVDVPKGSPKKPLDQEELVGKLASAAPDSADALLEAISSLETAETLQQLMDAIS